MTGVDPERRKRKPPLQRLSQRQCFLFIFLPLFSEASGECKSYICRQSVENVALCNSRSFKYFPPAAPDGKPSNCWVGTNVRGNGKRFFATEIVAFNVKKANFSQFNKNALRSYTNLKEIKLNECKLPFIPKGLFNFYRDIPHDVIKTISITEGTIAGISPGAFENLKQLEVLSLSWNALSSLPNGIFSDLHSVSELYLKGNKFTEFNLDLLSNMTNLRVLDLSENPIQQLGNFPSLPELRELNLGGMNLTTIGEETFFQLPHLQKVSLDGNRLLFLPEELFSKNPFIYEISMKNNVLEVIPSQTLGNLCELETLDLRGNHLTTPDVAWIASLVINLDDPNQDKLYDTQLSGNPWKCNATDQRLTEYMLFLETLKGEDRMREGLLDFVDVTCSDLGGRLSDSGQSHPILNPLSEKERKRLLLRNDCKDPEDLRTTRKAYSFVYGTCGCDPIEPIPPQISTSTQTQPPSLFLLIGIGVVIIGIIAVCGVFQARNYEKCPQKSSSNSRPSSFSEISGQAQPELKERSSCQSMDTDISCLSDPGSSQVMIDTESFLTDQRPSPPPHQHSLSSVPIQHPSAASYDPKPESFSFKSSNESITFSSNSHLTVEFSGDNQTIDSRSETHVKVVYNSPEMNVQQYPNLAAQIDKINSENVYINTAAKKSVTLTDHSGYTAAGVIPSLVPTVMPGYATMKSINGGVSIHPSTQFLPCNAYRTVPQTPDEYAVTSSIALSSHEYESIKDGVLPARTVCNHCNNVAQASNPAHFQAVSGNLMAQNLSQGHMLHDFPNPNVPGMPIIPVTDPTNPAQIINGTPNPPNSPPFYHPFSQHYHGKLFNQAVPQLHMKNMVCCPSSGNNHGIHPNLVMCMNPQTSCRAQNALPGQSQQQCGYPQNPMISDPVSHFVTIPIPNDAPSQVISSNQPGEANITNPSQITSVPTQGEIVAVPERGLTPSATAQSAISDGVPHLKEIGNLIQCVPPICEDENGYLVSSDPPPPIPIDENRNPNLLNPTPVTMNNVPHPMMLNPLPPKDEAGYLIPSFPQQIPNDVKKSQPPLISEDENGNVIASTSEVKQSTNQELLLGNTKPGKSKKKKGFFKLR